MLSLSSKKYMLPVYREKDEAWYIYDHKGNLMISSEFQYTYLHDYRVNGKERVSTSRMTFLYGANQSVRPHGRTLRILGKDDSARVVSALSRLTTDNVTERYKATEDLIIQLMPKIIANDNHMSGVERSE